VAWQKGRIDEQDMQHARDQAAEKGRVQGVQEERNRENAKQPQPEGMGTGAKIVIGLVVILIIAALLAVLTLSVSVTDVSTNYALPYTTTYSVAFPEGQPIAIGNSQMTVLSFDDELISDIDGNRQKRVDGEDRVINERRAIVTTLGVIKLMDTNFQVNLKYKGNRDNLAYFDMAIHTSQQVPEVLLKQLLPREIQATPM
jgi:hypothetical protein